MQQLFTLLHFLSGYVTSMPRCLQCEASPQWSPGKSDLTCLSYPKLGTHNTFFLIQNPALLSVADRLNLELCYIVEHSYTVLVWVLLFHAA